MLMNVDGTPVRNSGVQLKNLVYLGDNPLEMMENTLAKINNKIAKNLEARKVVEHDKDTSGEQKSKSRELFYTEMQSLYTQRSTLLWCLGKRKELQPFYDTMEEVSDDWYKHCQQDYYKQPYGTQ